MQISHVRSCGHVSSKRGLQAPTCTITRYGCSKRCLRNSYSGRHSVTVHATGDVDMGVNMQQLSNLISLEPLEPEKRHAMEQLAQALDVPMGVVKNMVFKRKALVNLTPDEVLGHIDTIASIVEVSKEQAREMAIIQPGLLFETEKQAQTLASGIKAICYELDASKEEVLELILKNQSILHGRALRLSVADMAHLSMLREPKRRIID